MKVLLLIGVLLGCLHVGADEIDSALDAESASQTSTVITVIFDNSGSMAEGQKMDQARRAFGSWLAALPESYGVGLIHFNKGKANLSVPIGKGNRVQVAKSVNSLNPYGKTPICSCLQTAAWQIKKRRAEHSPYERHVVVVFTDGYETVDQRQNKGVVAEINELRKQNIEVIGIGFHGQGDYMQPAATRYFHASNEDELIAGLAQVDAEIENDSNIEVSASDMKLISSTDIPIPPAPITKSK